MMYSNKLATAVKVDGKILREQGDQVFMPFGSEYSIYLRNLNSLRALVSIEIDGENATPGTKLILPANGTLELERFIKNVNFSQGNRFKFIERTAEIENGPRGVRVEDGLIRIEFDYEYEILNHSYFPKHTSGRYGMPQYTDSLLRGMSFNHGYSAQCSAAAAPGITVPGSVSDQKFTEGEWFPTQNKPTVIVLKLCGEHKGVEVVKPLMVNTKLVCTTCGAASKSSALFCDRCGTSLTLK